MFEIDQELLPSARKRTMKHEPREEHIMSDEAGAGQRPMSRRDALKTAGLAGAAALSTGAVIVGAGG